MVLPANDVPSPTILVLAGAYLPGYKAGGPIQSIANIVAALGGELNFRIVTLDRDLGDKSPYRDVPANRWVRTGHAEVMYLRPGLLGFLRMCVLLGSVDRNTVVYLNSFFARRTSMLAVFLRWLRLCRPRCLVLAPRGEFSLGALGLKRSRKVLYTRIAGRLGLYRGLIWHASSKFEAEDIARQFPLAKDNDVAGVVPGSHRDSRKALTSEAITASDISGGASPAARDTQRKIPGQLRAVFVARCSRKKNLSGALRMLKGVSGDVSFDIYGPAEDTKYWGECQVLIAGLPPNIRVRYNGEIAHERVGQVFTEHDLFLFPTLGENFGHVIAEALLAGCPVLTSDQTPWRNLEAEGVGWDIPLSDMDCFRSVLQQCVDGDGEWFTALSERARNYAVERAADPQIINANRELFRRAIAWPFPNTPLAKATA